MITEQNLIVFAVVFAVSYVWHALGVTIGYHRLLTHRSFSCPKLVEYFWVLAGYLAFEGSPIWWVTIHRAHHRYEDTPLDPHSPKNGLAHACFGWMLDRDYAAHVQPADLSRDLIADRVYKFLEQGGDWHKAHRLSFFIGLTVRLLILLVFGWVPALASLLAGLIVMQVPLVLNVVCHMPRLGYRNFHTGDDSVNVWWVGLLALGEGWHNNHHASPGSARTGLRFLEFDPTWHTICFMKAVGLASGVKAVTPAQLLKMERLTAAKLMARAEAHGKMLTQV